MIHTKIKNLRSTRCQLGTCISDEVIRKCASPVNSKFPWWYPTWWHRVRAGGGTWGFSGRFYFFGLLMGIWAFFVFLYIS